MPSSHSATVTALVVAVDLQDGIGGSTFATIWKVKCTVGRERHSVFCLMQKYVDVEALGTKLQIISAFAVEHVKGFIYIEAEKQCDINEVVFVDKAKRKALVITLEIC
ncbi:putative NGN domain, nusG domain superfamily, transcription elongation factor SPT5 [Helianthus debilis subsp. tardiflorus]